MQISIVQYLLIEIGANVEAKNCEHLNVHP